MDTITGKILKQHHWPDGKVIGIAKKIGAELADQGLDRETILARLDAVRQNPGSFLADDQMAELARECIRISQPERLEYDTLRDAPLQYPIWGRENIDEGSIAQMDNAMRLPVSVAGALMPDAHVGYGLPIGGVLATENAVIPYAVGVDIACRMRLSLYEVSPHLLAQKKGMFEEALQEQTAFGMGAQWKGSQRADHEVLDDSAWSATHLLASLKDNAV
jgi:tRNA-splicing ligase RtcB